MGNIARRMLKANPATAEIRNKLHKRLRDRRFVFLPHEIIAAPPIQHRGQDIAGLLSTFDGGITASLLDIARAVWGNGIHTAALAASRSTIQEERRRHVDFHKDWRKARRQRRRGEYAAAPEFGPHTFGDQTKLSHRPSVKANKAVKKAGTVAYRRNKKQLRRTPPDIIEVECSAYLLLRHGRLQNNSASVAKVVQTLDKLCQPIGNMPPLLKSWKRRGAMFALQVYGDWLEPPYWPVRLGFPMLSSTAFILNWWLRQLNTSQGNKGAIKTADMGKILRIPHRFKRRALTDAMNALNSYLAKLNAGLTADDVRTLDKARVPLIESYRIIALDNDKRLKFIHTPVRFNGDEPATEQPRRQIKRLILSADKLRKERFRIEVESTPATWADVHKLREELQNE